EPTAAFTPDGRLVYANAQAQHWLDETSTLETLGLEELAAAAQQTGVANAAAKLNGEACDILLACLGQDASSVVLVLVPHAARRGRRGRSRSLLLNRRRHRQRKIDWSRRARPLRHRRASKQPPRRRLGQHPSAGVRCASPGTWTPTAAFTSPRTNSCS